MQKHAPTRFRRRFRVQWRPNLIWPERRLVLTRVYWNRGVVGDGKGYSTKISVSLCWRWREMVLGVRVCRESTWSLLLWVFLLPCVALRFHRVRSYGGSFI